jgi:hypothetical protein
MDLERMKRISGINESLTLKSVPAYSTDTSKSDKSGEKQAKANNTTPKNKSAADVRTVDGRSDIDQNVNGTVLDDAEDDKLKITKMKAGKTDAGGQRTVTKHEKLNYTISIDPKTGCPKVDDELKKELIDVESWSNNVSYTECYVVASQENVYVCYEGSEQFSSTTDRNKATAFLDLDTASSVADLYDNSAIRRLVIEVKQDCCPTCNVNPCICESESESEDEDEEEELDDIATDDSEQYESLQQPIGDMVADINAKLSARQNVKIAAQYMGHTFTGYVKRLMSNMIEVQPTTNTRTTYKINNKTVMLPIEPTLLKWSQNDPLLAVGVARKHEPTQQINPDKKPGFYDRNPQLAPSYSKPSTWAVDMSAHIIELPSLNEYLNIIKEGKKEAEKVTINNLVAKHASKFNKAAVHRDRKKDDKRGVTKHKGDMDTQE